MGKVAFDSKFLRAVFPDRISPNILGMRYTVQRMSQVQQYLSFDSPSTIKACHLGRSFEQKPFAVNRTDPLRIPGMSSQVRCNDIPAPRKTAELTYACRYLYQKLWLDVLEVFLLQ